MKGIIAVLGLATLLAVTNARAQEETATTAPEATTPTTEATAPDTGRTMRLGNLDLRANFNADILLTFVNAGIGVDVGVLPLGPGVLALGGEIEAGACVTFCLGFNLLTGWDLSTRYLSPHARVTYHFTPPAKSPSLQKVDFYGLAFGGITYNTAGLSGDAGDQRFEYTGVDIGPSLGLGAGAKYFFKEDSGLFLGAEGRLRWSAGTYAWTARVGSVAISDTQSFWSLSGFNVQLFAGIRI